MGAFFEGETLLFFGGLPGFAKEAYELHRPKGGAVASDRRIAAQLTFFDAFNEDNRRDRPKDEFVLLEEPFALRGVVVAV